MARHINRIVQEMTAKFRMLSESSSGGESTGGGEEGVVEEKGSSLFNEANLRVQDLTISELEHVQLRSQVLDRCAFVPRSYDLPDHLHHRLRTRAAQTGARAALARESLQTPLRAASV